MKGVIDEVGHLHVIHRGKLKPQGCPYGTGSERCGDWCPKFGSIVKYMEKDNINLFCGSINQMEIVEDRRLEHEAKDTV